MAEKKGRGFYERKLVICEYCKRSFRGAQALSRHVNKEHLQQIKSMNEKMLSVIGNERNLSKMLKIIADQLETIGGSFEFTPEFKREMTAQDAKIQLALRVVAYSKIRKCLELTSQIETISQAIKKRFGQVQLESLQLSELLRIREDLEKSLHRDIEYLKQVPGFNADTNSQLIERLLDSLSSFGGRYVARSAQSVSISGIIPQDPFRREQIRKAISIVPDQVSEKVS
jgi:hypothetical protein